MDYAICTKKLNNLLSKMGSRENISRDEKLQILEMLRKRFIDLTFKKNGFTTAHWNEIDGLVCEEIRKLNECDS